MKLQQMQQDKLFGGVFSRNLQIQNTSKKQLYSFSFATTEVF